jgi:hypothetical protein
LLTILRNLFQRPKPQRGFVFSRPLVLLQSDDWGRVGVRDREGYEMLRERGLRLGERPYDLYTLETSDDVTALASLLARHHDCTGRAACLVTNTCTANLDFESMRKQNFAGVTASPLSKGLPGKWSRPGLFEAYHDGIKTASFSPRHTASLIFVRFQLTTRLLQTANVLGCSSFYGTPKPPTSTGECHG